MVGVTDGEVVGDGVAGEALGLWVGEVEGERVTVVGNEDTDG